MPRVGLCSRIQKGWLPLAFCGAFTQFPAAIFRFDSVIGGPTLRVAVKWVKAYNTTRCDTDAIIVAMAMAMAMTMAMTMTMRCDEMRWNAMRGDTSINSIFTNFLSRNIYKCITVFHSTFLGRVWKSAGYPPDIRKSDHFQRRMGIRCLNPVPKSGDDFNP